MMRWHKPQIETIFSCVPGETFWQNRQPAEVLKHVATIYEDLRPGRRAPKTLVNRPSVERLRELFYYDPETGVLRWKVARSTNVNPGEIAGSKKTGHHTFYRTIGVDGMRYYAHVLA